MSDSNDKQLRALAEARHREILEQETAYASEAERKEALSATQFFCTGQLKLTMPQYPATQVVATLHFQNGTQLKFSGQLPGFSATGEITIPQVSGIFRVDPASLKGKGFIFQIKQAGQGVPQFEIDLLDNSGPIHPGVLMVSPSYLVPARVMTGSGIFS